MTADQQVMKLWAGGYSALQIALRLSITVSHVNLILSPTLESHPA
jgi:DNA-binding CsgD family transcriptional regulator